MAWWRYKQARHTDKRTGVHPKRFKVHRWEEQMTSFFGESEAVTSLSNVGWMALAKDREGWRDSCGAFSNA